LRSGILSGCRESAWRREIPGVLHPHTKNTSFLYVFVSYVIAANRMSRIDRRASNYAVHQSVVHHDFSLQQNGIIPKPAADMESVTRDVSSTSSLILRALGDEFSRRILASAIAAGKTVQEISNEQSISLSTCYDKVGQLVDDGLMILETRVVTMTGKRYGVYRTSFSDATVKFSSGEIEVETKPNAAVLGKLHNTWLSYSPGPDNEKRRNGAVTF